MGPAECLAQVLHRELSSYPHRQKPHEHIAAGDGAAGAPQTPSGGQEKQPRGQAGPGQPGAHRHRHALNTPIFYSQAGVPPRGLSPRIRGCLNFNWRARVHPYPTSSCRRCCHGTAQALPQPCAGSRPGYPSTAGMLQRGLKRAALFFLGF